MPRVAKEMIDVSALVENTEPSTITAGTIAATTMAYGGTWRCGRNVRNSREPKIMSSRA